MKGDHARVSAEVYDPAAGTWVPIANMHGSYNGVTAMLLPDGMVLIAAGMWTGTFRRAVRHGHWGMDSGWTDGRGRRKRDAAIGWRRARQRSRRLRAVRPGPQVLEHCTGTTSRQHDGAPATLLLDGTVLVAGGATDTAELYVPAGVSPP